MFVDISKSEFKIHQLCHCVKYLFHLSEDFGGCVQMSNVLQCQIWTKWNAPCPCAKS